MEVTKEMVVESINTYCTERKYGSETLTDDFKEKFSNIFVKKYDQQNVEESDVIADLKFNLDTAFNASLGLKNVQDADFTKKENDYKKQIEELKKQKPRQQQQQETELPEEVKNQLRELEDFKNNARKREKFNEVLELAKKGVREDLHRSFEKFASDFAVTLDETSEEQAKKLTTRFQDIFKDSIGDIKPLAPRQTQKRDEEFLSSLPKIKV
jgi:TPP-dependent trihydroxycyclohexane-1,2-dione (THcHDO) dehydratase